MHALTSPLHLGLIASVLVFVGCGGGTSRGGGNTIPTSQTLAEVVPLPVLLEGPAGLPEAELSGLTRCGDSMVLLPQLVDDPDPHLFTVSVEEVLAALDDGSPITPTAVPLEMQQIQDSIRGFEGFEAIACDANGVVYLSIEARRGLSQMQGYVVIGEGLAEGAVVLDPESLVLLPEQGGLPNKSYEAVVFDPAGSLVAIYEANGIYVNPEPFAAAIDPDDRDVTTRPIDRLEYRLTDATTVDEDGRFWAMNYYFPGDMLLGDTVDDLVELYGSGASHRSLRQVERLVEYRFEDERVVRVDRPPILLELATDGEARNWEGIERLDDRGFLIVTDLFPTTLFAFVPMPEDPGVAGDED